MDKYGVRSVFSLDYVHRKCVDSTIERHGSPNPNYKYLFEDIKFDSKPELAYFIWLKD